MSRICKFPLCNTIQQVENLWICTENGMEVPIEELADARTQNENSQRRAKRSFLNLSWPKTVNYIDDDLTATAVNAIEESEKAESVLDLNERESSSSHIQADSESDNDSSSIWPKAQVSRDNYYQYEPLGPTQSMNARKNPSVRILQLSPGNYEDPLHGILKSKPLNACSKYEAVSYTWADETGDSARRRPLYIGNSWHRLDITKNCEATLRRFRQCDQEIDLWVDSVCIDQENLDERDQQVKLMPTIYLTAKSVLVYLGAGSKSTSDAMFMLGMQDKWAEIYLQDSKYIEALRILFRLPYFSRVWIIQELALAKEVRLFHGYDRQSVYLCHARDRVQRAFKATTPEDLMPLWLQHYEKRTDPSRMIGTLIFQGMSSNASRPEDKVFAFFGMICGAESQGLVADYSLAVEQVYTGIAAFLVSRGGLSNVLERSSCRTSIDWKLSDNHCGFILPSWVPNFDRTLRRKHYPNMQGYPPLHILWTSFGHEVQPKCIGVLRKTGSLVVCGYFVNNLLEKWPREISIESIFINYENSFRSSTDTTLLLCSKDNETLFLHLRVAETRDCYTFVGLCKIHTEVQPSEVDMIRLFSLNRPLLYDFSNLGQSTFNFLWTFYKLLGETVTKIFDPRPSLCHQISGDPWEDYSNLVGIPSENHDQHGRNIPTIQDRFLAFAEFHDFWASERNQLAIKYLGIKFEPGIMCTVQLNYDDQWKEWLRYHDITRSTIEEVMDHGGKGRFDPNDPILKEKIYGLEGKIEHWKNSTLDLIRGLEWLQGLECYVEGPIPLSALPLDDHDFHNRDWALYFDGHRVIRHSIDFSKPDNVLKLFKDMKSGIVDRMQSILKRKYLVKDDIRKFWRSLIGDWSGFMEVLSWVPEETTATDKIRNAFQQFRLREEAGDQHFLSLIKGTRIIPFVEPEIKKVFII